jgi:hypothetical protein
MLKRTDYKYNNRVLKLIDKEFRGLFHTVMCKDFRNLYFGNILVNFCMYGVFPGSSMYGIVDFYITPEFMNKDTEKELSEAIEKFIQKNKI